MVGFEVRTVPVQDAGPALVRRASHAGWKSSGRPWRAPLTPSAVAEENVTDRTNFG